MNSNLQPTPFTFLPPHCQEQRSLGPKERDDENPTGFLWDEELHLLSSSLLWRHAPSRWDPNPGFQVLFQGFRRSGSLYGSERTWISRIISNPSSFVKTYTSKLAKRCPFGLPFNPIMQLFIIIIRIMHARTTKKKRWLPMEVLKDFLKALRASFIG